MPFCCNKSPRQRNVQSDLTLHFRVGGYQFSSIYVIVFKSFRLQRVHTYPDSLRFQKFPLWSDRFQKFAVTVCVFAGYVWTLSVTATKCLRIQTNPDTCGRGLKLSVRINRKYCFLTIYTCYFSGQWPPVY